MEKRITVGVGVGLVLVVLTVWIGGLVMSQGPSNAVREPSIAAQSAKHPAAEPRAPIDHSAVVHEIDPSANVRSREYGDKQIQRLTDRATTDIAAVVNTMVEDGRMTAKQSREVVALRVVAMQDTMTLRVDMQQGVMTKAEASDEAAQIESNYQAAVTELVGSDAAAELHSRMVAAF